MPTRTDLSETVLIASKTTRAARDPCREHRMTGCGVIFHGERPMATITHEHAEVWVSAWYGFERNL